MEASASLTGPGQSVPAVASLACALWVGEEVFREALQKAPTLPKLADVGRAPSTLADAILARDAKEEERRRREAVRKDVKIKGKQVTPLPAVVEQAAPAPTPGLHIGNVNEASAFWLFVEDYFRDVTQEDIMALMPVALNPNEDDSLTVPYLGRDPRGMEPPLPTKGTIREDEDALERRGRGRGGGKLELRPGDATGAPGSGSQALLPQAPLLQPQATADALVQGWRQDGRPAATMLDACTDEEARAFCMLAHKLGLLDDGDVGLSNRQLGAPAFGAMDRTQLDRLLHKVSQLGGAAEGELGRLHHATSDMNGASLPPRPSDGAKGASADAMVTGDEDTQSSSTGYSQELPRAACGDYMHPYLRLLLERPCTAYVLNPCAGTGSLVDSAQDDEDAMGGGFAGGNRAVRGQGLAAGGVGFYTAKTPAPSKVAFKVYGSSAQDAGSSPLTAAFDPNSTAGPSLSVGPSGGNLHEQQLELQQLPPLPPQQQQSEDPSGAFTGSHLSASTPILGGLGPAADKAGAARGGRPRTSVNYSALAGKKDKEREREMKEREKEDRERAKSVVPKMKRKPGPKSGASWSAGGAGAGGFAGLQKPLTNNPLALLNKAPLLFKDDPGSNATTAAVHSLVAEGGPEGGLDQQWTQLDAAADVMSMAPDDEVLAELVALQSELVQQVAINRARVAAVMEAVVSDLPMQRAANQQRADMEEQIRVYLQRKAEVKRNLKREKREMEKRQALAALNEPASPRAVIGRPKKFASMPTGTYDGMGMGDGAEVAEPWRGGTPGVSGGEGGTPMELAPAADDFELVDALAQRTHDEEALCAICGDGLSVDPNMIVFCERCDIAVHQHCYGVRSIPAEEWLCWPCRLYEETQRATGAPQSEIRPKRWEMEARGITHAELPGGSLAVGCCLCPVRQGAFKRTTDGKAWCHVVCGLWHEGPAVLPMDSPDTIDNVAAIKPERWRSPCSLCQRVAGAVVKCNYGHCQAYFHPLCGRRAGNYLVARVQQGARTLRYRAYCHNHSEGQRNKDMQTGAAARALEVFTNAPSAKPLKRGGSVGTLSTDGVEGGFGQGGGAPNAGGHLDMQYGDQEAAAAAAAAAAVAAAGILPVKKKFGRPPKLYKQQQLLLQQMQLANAQVGLSAAPGELQAGLPALASPAAHAPEPNAAASAMPAGPAACPDAAGAMDGPSESPAAGLPSGPGGAVGRPPLPGSRLSLTAMAKRKAAVAAGGPAVGAVGTSSSSAGPAAPDGSGVATQPAGLEQPQPVIKTEAGPRVKAPGRGTPSTSLQARAEAMAGLEAGGVDQAAAASPVAHDAADELDFGQAGGSRAWASMPGAKATTSKTSSGAAGAKVAGKARQSSSGMAPLVGGGAAATTSSEHKQRLRSAVKEEPTAEGDSADGPSTSAAAAAAAAAARARAAAAAAAATIAAGGAVTLERLAELEHNRSMLGRWGPNSVRQELELLRTMADTVRRRERCKRSQYRLLRDATSAQGSQPEAVLALLEGWEWPPCHASPFSAEDDVEPPAVTALDLFLEANKPTDTARAAAGGAAAAGSVGSGGGAKRHRTDSIAAGVPTSSGGGEELQPVKRIRLKSSTPTGGPKETMKEIMSGRDWRRRVVMGPDGKWIPRSSPGGRGHKAGAKSTGFGGGSSKVSRDDGAAARTTTTELDEEVFEDAEGGFREGEAGGKDGDEDMEDATGDADKEEEEEDGNDDSGSSSSSSSDRDNAGDGGGGDGGDVRSGGGGNDDGGGDDGGGDGDSGPPRQEDGSGAASPRAGTPSAGGAQDMAMADAADAVDEEQGHDALGSIRKDRGTTAEASMEVPKAGGAGTAGGDDAVERAVSGEAEAGSGSDVADRGTDGAQHTTGQPTKRAAQQQQYRGSINVKGKGTAGCDNAGVSNGSRKFKGSEDDNISSDDAPIAALSRAVDLPREPRALMSQRTAEAVNAQLPRGYRFEKAP